MISVDEDGNVKGYLTDFDLVTTVGNDQNVTAEYQYWDASCRKGWPLPLVDNYGLAITLAESVVPDFTAIRDDPKKLTAANLDSEKEIAFRKIITRSQVHQDNLTECKTQQELVDRIDELLQGNISDELRIKLLELKKEIILVDFALTMALRLIEDSKNVYEYLKSNPSLVEKLTKGTEKEREEASVQIESESPYTTSAQMKALFETLQGTL